LLKQCYLGAPMMDALNTAEAKVPDVASVAEARAMAGLDAVAAGDSFGRTCYLGEAMPVIFHILTHADSFVEAVRANILCGGDSCGRAWIIGPAMAALHGVGGERGIPLSWLAQVTDSAALYRDIERLVNG
jgi:ADP-ribosylglycohydrolase